MSQLTAEEVRQQLHAILDSKDFSASQRLRDFLSYVVESTIRGNSKSIKAYTIAVDIFGLPKNFDPRINPLVRTEAGRLRSKLDHYYLQNPAAPIRISIPKGGYCAAFARHITPAKAPPSNELIRPYSFTPQKVSQSEYRATLLVLPFININKTNEVERFISGMLNEITIDLTKFKELRIVDYAKSKQLAEIIEVRREKALEPEARFVLSGSVQLEQNTFKVWVSLIDTTTNYNIWADKFDAPLNKNSLLDLQENIASSIVSRIADDFGLLQRTLLKEFASGAGTSSSIQEAALLYYHWSKVLTKKDFVIALESVKKAVTSNPNHIPSMAMLADLYASNYQWSYEVLPEDSLEKSIQIATQAINLDPECQLAHLAMCLNYYLRDEQEKFAQSAERTMEINPASTNVLSAIASWYGLCGFWEKALEMTEQVILANPTCPGWCHATFSMHHLMQKNYDESLRKAKKIHMPDTLWDPLLRMAAAGYLNEKEEYQKAMAELIKTYPEFKQKGYYYLTKNLPHKQLFERIYNGLSCGGLELPTTTQL